MTDKEKIGLISLIVLFGVLIGLLVMTFKPVGNRGGSFSDNILIDERQKKVNNQR